jgi:RimJ/RimL family protein N-acetyltransferase
MLANYYRKKHSLSQIEPRSPTARPAPRYLFYRSLGFAVLEHLDLPCGYTASLWWPSLRKPWPSGMKSLRTRARFAFRSVLDRAHIFATCEVGAVCVYYADQCVHYSGFTPRYWRFPFLADRDLQIGDTWTDPRHRGKGLAGYALGEILDMKEMRGRAFWYVVSDSNPRSIRVAERADFKLASVGDFHKRWGINLLGAYIPQDAGAAALPATGSARLGSPASGIKQIR